MKIKNILLLLLVICLILENLYFSVSYAEDSNIEHGKIQIDNKKIKFNITENKHKNTKKYGFYKTKDMNYKHKKHIALLLPNGKVLIRDISTAEIYDPNKNQYVKLPNQQFLGPFYAEKTAKIMSDGNVLIFQRNSDAHYTDFRMELFDYKTQLFKKFNPQLPYELKLTDYIKNISAYILSSHLILFKFNSEYYLYNYNTNTFKEITWNENDYGNNILYSDDGLIIVMNTKSYYKLCILQYNIDKNCFDILANVRVPELLTKNILVDNDNIYFFTGSTRVDNAELREGKHLSNIYKFNLKTKKFEHEGFLSNGANHSSILLKDGRILLNTGQFKEDYVFFETYDPKTKTSSFTNLHPWYRDAAMTLLDDGQVLFTGGWFFKGDALYGTENSFIYRPDYGIYRKKYLFKKDETRKPSLNEIYNEVHK